MMNRAGAVIAISFMPSERHLSCSQATCMAAPATLSRLLHLPQSSGSCCHSVCRNIYAVSAATADASTRLERQVSCRVLQWLYLLQRSGVMLLLSKGLLYKVQNKQIQVKTDCQQKLACWVQASDADFAQWQYNMARRRSQGQFFQNLYTAEDPGRPAHGQVQASTLTNMFAVDVHRHPPSVVLLYQVMAA